MFNINFTKRSVEKSKATKFQVVGVLVGVVLLSGCSLGSLSSEQVEKMIEETVSDGDLPLEGIESIKCPEKFSQEKGTSFDCEVKHKNGANTVINAENKGREGTKVKFYFKTKGKTDLVSVDITESYLKTELKKQGKTITSVDCGFRKIIPVDDGMTFECSVEKATGSTEDVELLAVVDGDEVLIKLK